MKDKLKITAYEVVEEPMSLRTAERARQWIEELPERFGYRSEAAFCRAFKREFGVSPGSDRRAGPAPLLSA